MMNHAGFAPHVPKNVVRLTISLMAMGVFAVGLLMGPATASADGDVNNCSAVAVNLVCVGQVNNNPVTINTGDVASNLLTGNEINTLTLALDTVVGDILPIGNINILSAQVNTLVQTAVNTWITTVTTITNTVTNTVKTCTPIVTPAVPPLGSGSISITCS